MSDMENKDMIGSLENDTPVDGANAVESEENPTRAEQEYQYQPPVNRQTPPYGGYSFGQQPAQGSTQTSSSADQWKFPDYGAPKKPEKKKKGKGVKVFAGIMGTVLGVAVLCFAAFGIYSLVMPQQNVVVSPQSQSQDEGDTILNGNVPELQTNSKPSDNTVSNDGTLTTAQINEKVAPSVVGIVQYLSLIHI